MEYERLSKRYRRVLTLAQEEAQRLGHNYIGTEHLLLGMLRDNGRAIRATGVDPQQVREKAEGIMRRVDCSMFGWSGLTPRAKKVIRIAAEEAQWTHSKNVTAGYLLVGLVKDGEGIAAGVLESFGVTVASVSGMKYAS